jgi:hypothetical protein
LGSASRPFRTADYRFVPAKIQPPATPSRRKWAWTAGAIIALAAIGWLVWWQFYIPSKYLAPARGGASLAVVPFECLSPDSESSALARGLSESLVSELSNLPGLQVLSPAPCGATSVSACRWG